MGALRVSAFILVLSGCVRGVPEPPGGEGPGKDAGGSGRDAGAGEPRAYEDPLEVLGRMSGSTFVEILEVQAAGNRVYFCSGVQGLRIVDVSDPARPTSVGQLVSAAGSFRYPRCQHLAVSGDFVYFTSRGDEIQPVPFVSAFDLGAVVPTEVAVWQDPNGTVEGIAAAGDWVYVARHDRGIAVLRRENAAFSEVATLGGFDNAWGLAQSGDLLAVADGVGGLVTVDVTDPAAPQIRGRVATPGAAQHVALSPDGRTAFVAAGAGGLVSVDVSDPSAPAVLATIDTPGASVQVSLSGTHAWVADWRDVRVFDVADPAAPRLLAVETLDTGGPFSRVLGVGASGNHGFAGEWTGLYALRLHPGRTAPELWIDDDSLEFGAVAMGALSAEALILRNEGTEPLVLAGFDIQGPAFSTRAGPMTLSPGEAGFVEVEVTPPSTAMTTGVLTIASDDPDESAVEVGLVVNRPGAGVGDPAPDVAMSLLGGGAWKLSEARGNVVVLAYFATF